MSDAEADAIFQAAENSKTPVSSSDDEAGQSEEETPALSESAFINSMNEDEVAKMIFQRCVFLVADEFCFDGLRDHFARLVKEIAEGAGLQQLTIISSLGKLIKKATTEYHRKGRDEIKPADLETWYARFGSSPCLKVDQKRYAYYPHVRFEISKYSKIGKDLQKQCAPFERTFASFKKKNTRRL